MAKAKKTASPSTSTEKAAPLATGKRNVIVKAWTDAMTELGSVGGKLAERLVSVACGTLDRDYVVTVEDAKALAADAARIMGWKRDRFGEYRSRASEIRAFLLARRSLGEAIKELRGKDGGPCTWNNALKLAKLLNGGKSVKSAALKVRQSRANGGESEPETEQKAKAGAASRIKTMLAWSKLPRAFKAGLRQLCAEHNVVLGKA